MAPMTGWVSAHRWGAYTTTDIWNRERVMVMPVMRKPKGAPNGAGGQFDANPMRDVGRPPMPPTPSNQPASGVYPAPPAWETAGWEAKNRIDLLASRGDAQGAVSLARSIGAFCPGDRIPYAEGYVAIFDGRTLESAFVQGRRVTMCEQFMPETVRVPGRDA